MNVTGFGLPVSAVVVEAWLTVCVKTAEVLADVFESPVYFAVMECEPALRVERESCPELPARLMVPSSAVPSNTDTVPPAVPPKAG